MSFMSHDMNHGNQVRASGQINWLKWFRLSGCIASASSWVGKNRLNWNYFHTFNQRLSSTKAIISNWTSNRYLYLHPLCYPQAFVCVWKRNREFIFSIMIQNSNLREEENSSDEKKSSLTMDKMLYNSIVLFFFSSSFILFVWTNVSDSSEIIGNEYSHKFCRPSQLTIWTLFRSRGWGCSLVWHYNHQASEARHTLNLTWIHHLFLRESYWKFSLTFIIQSRLLILPLLEDFFHSFFCFSERILFQ